MVLDPSSTIAVVGASLAGLRAAEALRAEGHRGPVVVIGAEPHLPYDRPPAVQAVPGRHVGARPRPPATGGEARRPRARPSPGPQRRGTRPRGAHARARRREPTCDSTGWCSPPAPTPVPSPEPPPCPGCTRCARSRTAIALGQAARRREGARVVGRGSGVHRVRGGGHLPRPRGRASPWSRPSRSPWPACSAKRWERRAAPCTRDHGVELLTEVGVAALRLRLDRGAAPATVPVGEVELDDGTVLEADVVVVGIGVVPTTAWLEGSGLEIADGVVCRRHAVRRRRRGRGRGRGSLVRRRRRGPRPDRALDQCRRTGRGRGRATCWPGAPTPRLRPGAVLLVRPVRREDPGDRAPEPRRRGGGGGRVARTSAGSSPSTGAPGGSRAALGFSRPRQLMGYRPLLAAGATFDDALAQRPA